MNEHIDFKEKLIDTLLTLPAAHENATHVILQCPQCETLRDKSKSGHFYISKVKEGFPGSCKKCSLSFGKINIDIINKLGITDVELSSYVKENYKKIHSHIINLDERSKRLNYIVNSSTSHFDKLKISMLSDRLLHDLDNEEDIKTYRIITNLSNFIKLNHIDMNKYDSKRLNLIQLIDRHYIGFLSYFGNKAVFRNMTGDNNYPRYITFVISDEISRSFFYTPVSDIDPITDIPKITIAEGPIDIIALHLTNKCYDNNNNIYAAASSTGSFRSAIKSCLYITGYFGAEINIYLDNDELVKKVSNYDFDLLSHAMTDFSSDFKLIGYINLSSKDFGDLREKITLAKVNLNPIIEQYYQ